MTSPSDLIVALTTLRKLYAINIFACKNNNLVLVLTRKVGIKNKI